MKNGVYVKRDEIPQRMQLEVIKARAAHDLAVGSKLFRVPRVLYARGDSIGFEHIEGLGSLREYWGVSALGSSLDVANRVGRSLACIHSGLALDDDQQFPMGSPFNGPSVVPIHGDFGLKNVQISSVDGEIYILDWSTPLWLGDWCSEGSAEWDLGLFLVDMFYQRPGDPARIPQTKALAREFLRGYAGNRRIDTGRLRRGTRSVARQYFRMARGGFARYLRIPGMVGLAIFLANDPLDSVDVVSERSTERP